jgi:hypothetical protein
MMAPDAANATSLNVPTTKLSKVYLGLRLSSLFI